MNHDKCNAGFRSEIKTLTGRIEALTAENARLTAERDAWMKPNIKRENDLRNALDEVAKLTEMVTRKDEALKEIHREADEHAHETGALLRASVSIIRAKARKALSTVCLVCGHPANYSGHAGGDDDAWHSFVPAPAVEPTKCSHWLHGKGLHVCMEAEGVKPAPAKAEPAKEKPSREEIRARGYTPPCCDRLGRTHATDCRKSPPAPSSEAK